MPNALLTDKEVYLPSWSSRIWDQELLSGVSHPVIFGSYLIIPQPVSPALDQKDSSSLPNVRAEELTTQSNKFLAKLTELTRLGYDWDSYGSPPPSPDFVNGVIRLLSRTNILEIQNIEAFPISGGGIQIEWSSEPQEIEIAFYPNDRGTFLITLETGDVLREGSFNFATAIPTLRSIGLRASL